MILSVSLRLNNLTLTKQLLSSLKGCIASIRANSFTIISWFDSGILLKSIIDKGKESIVFICCIGCPSTVTKAVLRVS